MVSVFEGQLTRTWCYSDEETWDIRNPTERRKRKKHIINLYHDTITGVFFLYISPFFYTTFYPPPTYTLVLLFRTEFSYAFD
jgi:hypothetical protein